MELNELRDCAYKTACEHGFHEDELSNRHFLMLVITELSEAVEADRKGKEVDIKQFECGVSYSKNDFKKVYEFCIKGSVEEELADAAIRLLDLAGLRDIEVQRIQTMDEEYVSLFKSMPFPECIYDIVLNIVKYESSISSCINISLASIFALAECRDIDMIWHINEKMKYNELRPNKHGKLY